MGVEASILSSALDQERERKFRESATATTARRDFLPRLTCSVLYWVVIKICKAFQSFEIFMKTNRSFWGFRAMNGVEGLNEIHRLEVVDGLIGSSCGYPRIVPARKHWLWWLKRLDV